MTTWSDDGFGDMEDSTSLRALFDAIAAEDGDLARALLGANPALADEVLSDADLGAMLRDVLAGEGSALEEPNGAQPAIRAAQDTSDSALTPVSPASATDDPGLFTELTRELAPERAAALYRKIVPLLVYELLRTLDQSANVATVQRIVDHLCSPAVQTRLRQCAHVRDGILDELCALLHDTGLRDALDREAVLAIMADCGVTGELMTLVNCIQLIQANAG